MHVAKTIEIQMKSGQVFTLDMSETLLERIRTSFDLDTVNHITERHVKYYLTSAMKRALEEADGKAD